MTDTHSPPTEKGARQTSRKLRRDPEHQTFVGDDEANCYLDRPKRKGYELPEPV